MPHARKVTRRDFLKCGSGSVALSWVISTGFAKVMPTVEAAPKAVLLQVLSTQEARTLLAMTRTLFPHDFLADDSYMKVVAAVDTKASSDAQTASLVRAGLTTLGKTFSLLSESEREHTLRALEKSPFFTFVHGETLNNLYGDPEVWKIFGYEGSSLEHGGYIHRGFDDIDWLPTE
jgi:hypothetical protein